MYSTGSMVSQSLVLIIQLEIVELARLNMRCGRLLDAVAMALKLPVGDSETQQSVLPQKSFTSFQSTEDPEVGGGNGDATVWSRVDLP
ncbi:hypothetical protein A6R68_13650 [Neotoma lepida]|uniref:Uncharacterized protein n=1 Tax=Neotoma lepida TaxID=56216 RepID=A0A1A6H0J9_NEOLE|nr:hypothetical protein A6R68_13650 [Neotoma lepida]